jgi:hypothetical protein
MSSSNIRIATVKRLAAFHLIAMLRLMATVALLLGCGGSSDSGLGQGAGGAMDDGGAGTGAGGGAGAHLGGAGGAGAGGAGAGGAGAVDGGAPDDALGAAGTAGGAGAGGAAGNLVALSVTPFGPSIAKSTTLQFTATGAYSDGSTRDVTGTVTWASSAMAVATVDAKGLATGVAPGQTTISASMGGINGSSPLTVTAATLASITVTPASPVIAKATAVQFTATGVYSDNTTQDLTAAVTWSSSMPTVASVSNAAGSQGVATGLTAGQSTITATSGGISGTTTLTVTAATLMSVAITPANPSIPRGATVQFTATGAYSDGSTQNLTTQVTWGSSAMNVAVVSNAPGSKGLATGLAGGMTTVTAALNGVAGATQLTVTMAMLTSITVTPANGSLAKGSSQPYTATGHYADGSTQNLTSGVVWMSSAPMVAIVSNGGRSQGVVSAVAEGTAMISASVGNVSGSTMVTVTAAVLRSISVSPPAQMVKGGATVQYTATGVYSDNSMQDITKQASWTSSNTNVAVVSNGSGSQGLVTAVGNGQTEIRATSNGITGTGSLQVRP